MTAVLKRAALLIFVLCLCLALSGCEAVDEVKELLAKPIVFENGEFHPNSTELCISLSAHELPLLDSFEELQSVDFANSSCYTDIVNWAKEHPDIQVRCAVPLPNGQSVQMMSESLDLSGLAREDVAQTAEALGWLPRLKAVDLGKSKGEEGDLSIEDLNTLKNAKPGAVFDCDAYAFRALGQSISLDTESLDLSQISSEQVEEALALISNMPRLSFIELGKEGGGLSWEDILHFQRLFPDIKLHYEFQLYGKTFTINDETIDISFINVGDDGEAVRKVLPYLLRCNYVDMDSCGVSNEKMAALRDEFPHVKIVWRIFFGPVYTARTDAERILASKPTVGGNLVSSQLQDLKYCTDVKYLDLGHNETIADISFMSTMTKLEVVILSMNLYTNVDALANATNMEYLEIFDSNLENIEALRGMTKLKHLNICHTKVTDLSPIYDLDLERLYIGYATPIPAEQIQTFKELHPDCEVNTTVDDPHSGSWVYGNTNCWPWQYHERYALLREQMQYDALAYNFKWLDEKYSAHFPG